VIGTRSATVSTTKAASSTPAARSGIGGRRRQQALQCGGEGVRDEYAKFEPVPGAHINPALTMGENVADFAGVQGRADALSPFTRRQARSGARRPDRRPAVSSSPGRRSIARKQREDALRSQVTTDPHSPGTVSGPRPAAEHPGVVRCVRDHARQFNVHPARRSARISGNLSERIDEGSGPAACSPFLFVAQCRQWVESGPCYIGSTLLPGLACPRNRQWMANGDPVMQGGTKV